MTGGELKAVRTIMKMSEAELGAAIKLKGSRKSIAKTVRRWERGEREISGPVEVAVLFLLNAIS